MNKFSPTNITNSPTKSLHFGRIDYTATGEGRTVYLAAFMVSSKEAFEEKLKAEHNVDEYYLRGLKIYNKDQFLENTDKIKTVFEEFIPHSVKAICNKKYPPFHVNVFYSDHWNAA